MPTAFSDANPEQAWRLLAERVRSLDSEPVALEQALGRVLHAPVDAGSDYPPFDRARMDGYAVRTADFHARPARLKCDGLAAAGADPGPPLQPGVCRQINTGGMIPPNCDAVVIVEQSEPLPDGLVALDDAPTPGQHIERAASLMARGARILEAGQALTPGSLSGLAAIGIATVTVTRRPRVGVLTTGNELVSPGDQAGAGQIYDSNTVLLRSLIPSSGAELVFIERCPDDPGRIREVITRGLRECDLLCVAGGMSRGSLDLVPSILEACGVQWHVTSLNLKPGKPTRIGQSGDRRWVIGLPGNPVSCAVCFLLFGRPILSGLAGAPIQPPARLRGRLATSLPANGNRPMYHPAIWSAGAAIHVKPVSWTGSGDPFGLMTANALIRRDGLAPRAEKGTDVDFVPIDLPA